MRHHQQHSTSRRDFLRLCSILGLGSLTAPLLPGAAIDGLAGLTATSPQWDRSLILIELDGGNDGLNTIIPVDDANYYAARQSQGVAIPKNSALPLTGQPLVRLHPRLAKQQSIWDAGDLAIITGVGYAQHNRSHFRGIDIWNTGSDALTFLDTGWIGRCLAGTTIPDTVVAEGTVLRRAGSSPLEHSAIRNLAMSDPEDFIDRGSDLLPIEPEQFTAAAGRPGLEHLLTVHEQVRIAAGHFQDVLAPGGSYSPPSYNQPFPDTSIGNQFRSIADMLVSGLRIPVHKVSYNGFDTHANQVDSGSPTTGTHANLLGQLDDAIAAFRAACIQHGIWDRVTCMTYSEFGRRLTANASRGTDHGGASSHCIWGGGVQGGLYGSLPSLAEDDLDRGDPVATTDFRQLYTTCLTWLGLDASLTWPSETFTPIPCLAA